MHYGSTTQSTASRSGSHDVRSLIQYARTNYRENPTESLAALMQALTLNGGPDSADAAMARLRSELGEDIADLVGNRSRRMEQAINIIESLLNDTTTFLYEQGNQDLLRQTVEDGSSVVCRRCNDVVSSARWQQHQMYWCRALDSDHNLDGHV